MKHDDVMMAKSHGNLIPIFFDGGFTIGKLPGRMVFFRHGRCPFMKQF
jgi:hypothetical protein